MNLLQFNSSYAQVYKQSHQKNCKNPNNLVSYYQDQCKLNPEIHTFEYSISQITHDFKALVDYIWYNSQTYQPSAILQTVDYHHLENMKSFKKLLKKFPKII